MATVSTDHFENLNLDLTPDESIDHLTAKAGTDTRSLAKMFHMGVMVALGLLFVLAVGVVGFGLNFHKSINGKLSRAESVRAMALIWVRPEVGEQYIRDRLEATRP